MFQKLVINGFQGNFYFEIDTEVAMAKLELVGIFFDSPLVGAKAK